MGGLPSQFGVDHDSAGARERVVDGAGAGCIFSPAARRRRPKPLSCSARRSRSQRHCRGGRHARRNVNLGGGFGIPYFAKDLPLTSTAGLRPGLGRAAENLADTEFAIEPLAGRAAGSI
jgi:diaminopimelate decarboxylase